MTDDLPAGPGLVPRWLAAAPLMVVSMFAPWVGQLALAVWWQDEQDEPFWQQFDDALGGVGWLPVYLPMFVLTWFLLRRTRMAGWPVACLVVACLLLAPGVVLFDALLPNLAFAVGLAWLSWELGRQVVRILTWPPAWDLVRSELELVYAVPAHRARLRVQHDRLVLDRLPGTWVLPLDRVKEVRVEEVPAALRWQDRIEVPAGYGLLVRGGKKHRWLLPVTEDLGCRLVAAIEARAR